MAEPSMPPPRTAACKSIAKMAGSSFVVFNLKDSETTRNPNLAAGGYVREDVTAGGHSWSIRCHPHATVDDDDDAEYISLFLELTTRSASTTGVRAMFQAFFNTEMDGGDDDPLTPRCSVHDYNPGDGWGWAQFARRADLDFTGDITLVCGVVVAGGGGQAIPVPPSDMRAHLGHLLDSAAAAAGTADVSFVVGGQTFSAHRAVLAARSPVFNAQLFGSTPEATSPSIRMRDIEPATFGIVLRFIYTDALPGDDELVELGSITHLMQRLLAAADRFAMDRMKLVCASKLWDNISVESFASTLACAEMFKCPELKRKCIEFFSIQENFKKIAFTDHLMWLMQKFPSLEAKLKDSVGI